LPKDEIDLVAPVRVSSRLAWHGLGRKTVRMDTILRPSAI